ncbi:MAG TPA: UvrD-helicase domain-containing protein, partial [Treponemataceae bacterium]|nr:UvrD-helicase domain-containing protein [Treponemataceae bacterium]
MTFLLSSTFTDSLARLSADEQKLAKTTAFDLQVNPANPGHQFHKLDAVRDKDFWSVRVSSDLRIIVHKTTDSLMLCYVDHHDKAYAWAERRKLETHPSTGASQLVEIRETVKDIVIPRFVDGPVATQESQRLFARYTDSEILSWGVPEEWLADVKTATEGTVLEIADHLPAEASEAILEVATGGRPRVRRPESPDKNPFVHPDAQRRFRMLDTPAELDQALNSPWDTWITFLHPDQIELIEHEFAGPSRVSGSAGTGKTIVALHRACFLARHDENARVLLVTFSDILANALRQRLVRLIASNPKLSERIEVHSMESLGLRLFKQYRIEKGLIPEKELCAYLFEAAKSVPDHGF